MKKLVFTTLLVGQLISTNVIAQNSMEPPMVSTFSRCYVEEVNVVFGPVLRLQGGNIEIYTDGSSSYKTTTLSTLQSKTTYTSPIYGPFGPFGGGYKTTPLTKEDRHKMNEVKNEFITAGICPKS